MLKVIIDRTKWLRGEGNDKSRLLRPSDGKMCCIGFACLAAGIPKSAIEDRAEVGLLFGNPSMPIPESLKLLYSRRPSGLGEESGVCHNLYEVNDLKDYNDESREADIVNMGKDAGIAFSFIN